MFHPKMHRNVTQGVQQAAVGSSCRGSGWDAGCRLAGQSAVLRQRVEAVNISGGVEGDRVLDQELEFNMLEMFLSISS